MLPVCMQLLCDVIAAAMGHTIHWCLLARQGRDKIVETLFEDYVQANEDWMRSALLVQLTQSSTQRRRGKHVMMPFRDVRSKFGAALAQQILADKKALQNNKSPADPNTYFMAHPEAKDDEESHLNFFSFGLWVSTYLMLLIQLLKMWMIIYLISISNRACIQPGLIQNLGCCYPLAPTGVKQWI